MQTKYFNGLRRGQSQQLISIKNSYITKILYTLHENENNNRKDKVIRTYKGTCTFNKSHC